MTFRLQVASPADVPAIRNLIAASVRGLQFEYSFTEREAALATVFTVDTRLIADGTYFIAFAEDGSVAGCGGWSKRKTLYGGDHQVEAIEPGFLNPSTDAAKIRAIFVHPDFARQGLGSLILRASEQAAESDGFKRFKMGSTLAGQPLYQLRGYRAIGSIEVPVSATEFITVIRMLK